MGLGRAVWTPTSPQRDAHVSILPGHLLLRHTLSPTRGSLQAFPPPSPATSAALWSSRASAVLYQSWAASVFLCHSLCLSAANFGPWPLLFLQPYVG
jgi:hypothetical protein